MSEVKKGKIQGVVYMEPKIHADDRGFLIEVVKKGGMFVDVKQSNFTETHPGVIKAFHWHEYQTDLWFGVFGRAKAVLYDLRENSPTYKNFQEFYLGEPNFGVLLIPKKIAHGYQVLGNKNFGMFYHTDKIYNPDDENRIKFNALGYNWEIKNR